MMTTNNKIADCLLRVREAEASLAEVHRTLDELCGARRHLSLSPRPRSRSPRPADGAAAAAGGGAFAADGPAGGGEAGQAAATAAEAAENKVVLDEVLVTRSRSKSKRSLEEPDPFLGGIEKGESTQQLLKLNTAGDLDIHEDTNDLYWARWYCGLNAPVVHPFARVRVLWLLTGVVFVIYECFAVPIYLAFSVDPAGFFFGVSSLINCYYIVDVMFTFFVGYLSKRGSMVVSHRKIATRYVTGWFVLDLLVSIPWEWFRTSDGLPQLTRNAKVIRYLRMMPLLRLSRLMRLLKISQITESVEVRMEANHLFIFAFSLVKSVLALLFVMHWASCAWYAVGTKEVDTGTWVDIYLTSGMDMPQRYTWSLYFTMVTMTTVGYGDISPQTYDECRFALILLPLATVIFASVMGTLSDHISTLNHKARVRAEKKMRLSNYMRWRVVPWELMMRIRRHMVFLWETKEDFDRYEQEVKEQLSPNLQGDLFYHIYGGVLVKAPFLVWMKDFSVCMKQLATLVQECHLARGDFLFDVGQTNDHIYLLLRGKVWLNFHQHVDEQEELPKAVRQFTRRKDVTTLCRKKTGFVSELKNDVMQVRRSMGPVTSKASEHDVVGPEQDVFTQSRAMGKAVAQMREKDMYTLRAACLMQRHYRRWKARREATLLSSPSRSDSNNNNDILSNRTVYAPVYFGESCLWPPVQEWELSAPTFKYAARCITECDCVVIPRAAVQAVVERFPPWLPERLRMFQAAIRETCADPISSGRGSGLLGCSNSSSSGGRSASASTTCKETLTGDVYLDSDTDACSPASAAAPAPLPARHSQQTLRVPGDAAVLERTENPCGIRLPSAPPAVTEPPPQPVIVELPSQVLG